jgi:hypothetical protein
MVRSSSTPVPPRVSIVWLARHWDIGVSSQRFVGLVVSWVLAQGHKRRWWIARRGPMCMPDYFCLYNVAPDWGPGLIEWQGRQIAEDFLLGPEDLIEVAAAFDVPAPPWLATAQEATPAEHSSAPLTKEGAVARIIAEGKVPFSPEYPSPAFIADVKRLCGAEPEAKGYDRKTLREIYKRQKSEAPPQSDPYR